MDAGSGLGRLARMGMVDLLLQSSHSVLAVEGALISVPLGWLGC